MKRLAILTILITLLIAAGLYLARARRATGAPPLAEIAVLTAENFDALAPRGKEADAIEGDFVLRNDRLVAVIGDPVPHRDANISLRGVGGAVIDLTTREGQNDLLGVFYPGGGRYVCLSPQMTAAGPLPQEVPRGDPSALQGREVMLRCLSPGRDFRPAVTLTYTLRAGDPYLTVTTELTSVAERPFLAPLEDALIVQGPSFERSPEGRAGLFWAYDRWFGQAYGLVADGLTARLSTRADETTIAWQAGGADGVQLLPSQRYVLTRRLFPAADTIGVMAIAAGLRGERLRHVDLAVMDRSEAPVASADVAIRCDGVLHAAGRTRADGTLPLELPAGACRLEISSIGRGDRAVEVGAGPGPGHVEVLMESGSTVRGEVVEEGGGPIPCKVGFTGVGGTATPDFGPVVGEREVKNLVYTPDGRFSRVVPAGTYDITFSHGPEFDAATRRVEVPPGGASIDLGISLMRSVKTPGWVATDFHGHSTASGDTTASTEGRVLNLAAEGIEFAPCTEHNRIETYDPIIRELGLGRFLRSSPGIELTADPFPINHQNAFPMVMHPHTQGNGAPEAGPDPLRQIRRLSGWDGGSEKLVQQNHPDIGWMFFDADGDGRPDHGFAMLPYQDAIEVFGTNILKMEPTVVRRVQGPMGPEGGWVRENNRIFNWLQLLNQGIRLPGVANTDAHTNFHGSGGVRNYVACSTDDPAAIDPIEMVRSARQGHIVMSNGPYLEVTLEAPGAARPAIPGDTIAAPGGAVTLHARVQCPNWLDIDRVYVLLNGRIRDDLAFTRYKHPKMFSKAAGPVKFDQRIPITLGGDTHVIVVAAHKKHLPAPIVGPGWADGPPVAISNPIFVDVDGGGFKANGDTLGHPLPVKGGQPAPAPADSRGGP